MTLRFLPGRTAGGRGESRARRRLGRVLPALALAALTAGCATKRDIRDMRGDLVRLEERQDSVFRELQRQNREILDTLTATTERILNVRGDLGNRLQQVADQLELVGQLTGQVQVRLTQLDQQLTAAVNALSTTGIPPRGGQPGQDGPPSDGDAATFDEAQELYEIGVEQIQRGNAATARQAFQALVDSFPAHPSAAEAQRQIGETYVLDEMWDQALRAYDRVVERYQNSSAAPMALYRAGVISQERGQNSRARQYFQRVVSGYPNSDARRLAEEALRRLNE